MISIHLTEDQLQLAIEALREASVGSLDIDWGNDVHALEQKLAADLARYQNAHPYVGAPA